MPFFQKNLIGVGYTISQRPPHPHLHTYSSKLNELDPKPDPKPDPKLNLKLNS